MKQIACLLLALAAVAQFHGHFVVGAIDWPDSVKNGVFDVQDYMGNQIYDGIEETALENFVMAETVALGTYDAILDKKELLGSQETLSYEVLSLAYEEFQTEIAALGDTIEFVMGIILGFVEHHMQILRDTADERLTAAFAEVEDSKAATAIKDALIAEFKAALTEVEVTFVLVETDFKEEAFAAHGDFVQTSQDIARNLYTINTITTEDVAKAVNEIDAAALVLEERLFAAAEVADAILTPVEDSFNARIAAAVDLAFKKDLTKPFKPHYHANPKERTERFRARVQIGKQLLRNRQSSST